MHLRPSLECSAATILVSGALESARARGAAVSIAVVDDAGELLSFIRMDHARSYTVDLACEKARGAAKLGLATSVLESLGRKTASGNPWTRGGKPVLHDGQCAGAIEEIADEAIAALNARSRARHPTCSLQRSEVK